MTPDLVVDVGNTRIKWGLCRDSRVVAMASLGPADQAAWQARLRGWSLTSGRAVVAGVHPTRRDEMAGWLRGEGLEARLVESHRELPLTIRVDQPERVGIDRLLNAVAFNARDEEKLGGILVDAGSAVTVDWVDSDGAFRGGAIFPGLRLMAKALHDYTAKLPLVEVGRGPPDYPGTFTEAAIAAGIYWTAVGGIDRLILLGSECGPRCCTLEVYFTGGDAPLLLESPGFATAQLWPEMTLEGIRVTAEALP